MSEHLKRAVSVSLGSPSRDKKVIVNLNGIPLCVERIGTGGDAQAARRLFIELNGKVDALSIGGIDLYVHLDGRDYPIHAGLRIVRGVHRTPLVDGRLLKYALEGRLFELLENSPGKKPHFQRAFIPFGTDRIGLISAVSEIADDVLIGDLMFLFGLPVPVHGLESFKRLARILLPFAGYLPISMLCPPGAKEEGSRPKFSTYWQSADLIAGDMHYIRKYSPENLSHKTVITNTTTGDDIGLLRERGVHKVITTTPLYEGRSFGVNMIEAMLTAYAGKGRSLKMEELSQLIDEINLRPSVQYL